MRPLYQVAAAAHPAQQLQLPAQAQQWQLHGGVQPPLPPLSLLAQGGPHLWAAGGPAAVVAAAQQRQVEQPLAPEAKPALNNNKRAAEGLKARLQRDKRPRQPDGVTGIKGSPADAQPQQLQPQQQPTVPQWLEGAPHSIRQLAAPGASAACPEVLFLGTGSAEPSKYRAASAIQLRSASLLLPADALCGWLPGMHAAFNIYQWIPFPNIPVALLVPSLSGWLAQAVLRAEPVGGLRRGGAGRAVPLLWHRRSAAPSGQPWLPVGVA
jgi:hypothetical protein